MGIKGLTKLLKDVAADGLETLRIEDLSGARLAIDVSNFMYQFLYNAGAKKPNNHLAGFFQLVADLAKAQIVPVFILDGPSGSAKLPVLTKRRQIVQERQERLDSLATDIQELTSSLHQNLGPGPEKGSETLGGLLQQLKAKQHAAEQLEKQQIKITSQQWSEVVDFLQQLGAPVIQATSEADLLAAHLARVGLVHGVISEDTDHLAFGAPLLIRDFNNKRNPDLQVYSLPAILTASGLTQDQFIDLCILCGCDYTEHITGIGPATAYKLLRSGQSMATIVANCQKPGSRYTLPVDFRPELAHQLFTAEDPLVAELLADPRPLLPAAFDENLLSPFLQTHCHYRSTTLDPKFAAIRAWWATCPQRLKPTGWHFGPKPSKALATSVPPVLVGSKETTVAPPPSIESTAPPVPKGTLRSPVVIIKRSSALP